LRGAASLQRPLDRWRLLERHRRSRVATRQQRQNQRDDEDRQQDLIHCDTRHRGPGGGPSVPVLWVATILAAALFGLGHLPMTSMMVPLTPLIIVRAFVLNGLLGVGFGYLYWTRGLESAMLAHLSADLLLHVLLAL
jgi:hypothetical protein